MEKAYTRTNWEDDNAPLLDAENLNNIESGIDTLDNRVVELSEQSDEYAKKEEIAETYATKSELEGISETVTEIATEVSKGKSDVILANASGTLIHVEDSSESNAVEFKLIGASGSVEVTSFGKNFIPYPYYEKNHTDNGIEWKDLSDGRVMANGTASANSDYFLISYNAMRILKAGKYIVNGCPNGGGESTHSIIVGKKVNGTLTRIATANENGSTLTLTEDTEIYILCRVNAGQTVTNLTFEPMISIEGGKFEPYKESKTTINSDESTEAEVKLFYPVTNILNDAGCEMEITYKADTKKYIDNAIESITEKEYPSMGQEVILTNGVNFTCPEDGYLYLFCNKTKGQSGYGYVNNRTVLYISTPAEQDLASYIGESVFVKKGAVIRYGTNSSGCKAQYHPYA